MSETSEVLHFEGLIQSGLFTFHIGEDKRQFVVHSKIIATTSEYFDTLVNGDMVEAKTRVAELQDVRSEGFVRFLEYAYRHDYTVPCFFEEEDLQSSVSEPPVPSEPEPTPFSVEYEPVPGSIENTAAPIGGEWAVPVTKTAEKKKKKARPTLRSRFDKRRYLSVGDPKAEMLQNFEPQCNSSSRQNFTPVFLAHARLYTFADMRLIQPLRSLALHKIHKTLKDFRLYDRRVSDVLELARYAYDHGPDRTSNGTIDDLRDLVVQYIACELDTIGKHTEFRQLMEDGGEFVGDIWGILQNYVVSGLTAVVV